MISAVSNHTRFGVHVLLSLLRRTKYIRTGLIAAIFVFVASPAWAIASAERDTYATALGRDLDGDGISENALIHQSGSTYKISIQFTSGRPRLHLTVYYTAGETGLTLQTSDVNDDRKADLVVTSATSVRPLAVWLNRGKARFQKVSSWTYGGLATHKGPVLRQRSPYNPEAALNSVTDSPAHTVKTAEALDISLDTENLGPSNSERVPSDSVLDRVTARGPPLSDMR